MLKSSSSSSAVFLIVGLLAAGAVFGQAPEQRNYDRPPALVHKVEPSYTEEARANRFEGRALLEAVVDISGIPTDIKVLSPLGMGLDRKAIECAQRWRFKPGTKNGTPVAVTVRIEVNFRMTNSATSGARFDKLETMRAQYNLGVRSLNGADGTPDYVKALEFFRKAADEEYAPAQLALAKMYFDGLGLTRDPHLGGEWCLKAAKQGLAEAQFMEGLLAAHGEGVPRDDSLAAKWYRKAAEQGHPKAEFNLGMAYESGNGVKKDPREATNWFRKSADQGFADAQYRLGLLYRDGNGVQRDLVTALLWLTKSANQSFAAAVVERDKLVPLMAPDKVAETERLIRERAQKK